MIMMENKSTELKQRAAALVEIKKQKLEKEAQLRAQTSANLSDSS